MLVVGPAQLTTRSRNGDTGFTILELLVALVMLGILAAIAVPGYQIYNERARQSRALAELGELEIAVNEFLSANDAQLPVDLAAIGLGGKTDPWGNAWVYVNLSLGGAPRTDLNGDPVNVEYDLYSAGPDGATALSLTNGASADDIIRASDGGFFGVVSDYMR